MQMMRYKKTKRDSGIYLRLNVVKIDIFVTTKLSEISFHSANPLVILWRGIGRNFSGGGG